MGHRSVAIIPSSNLDASEAFYRRLGFDVISDYGHYRILADGRGWHVHLNHVPGWPKNIEDNPFGLYLYVDDVDAVAQRVSDLVIEKGTPNAAYRIVMGKSAAKSIDVALEKWRNLAAADGHVVPQKPMNSGVWVGGSEGLDGHLVPKRRRSENLAYLDGNIPRKTLPRGRGEYVIWDTDLAGFGMRVQPTGTTTWFVRLRRRGKQQRVAIGRTEDVDAFTARNSARQLLAEVALDGLPVRVGQRQSPLFSHYVNEFWRDCGHHWKPSTQKRNHVAIRLDIMPHFGGIRLDTIRRPDIIRWRDSCAEGKEAKFNRALPVLAAMLKYAEVLGHIRKGSNPCRGTPRFKREAMERFLSPAEYRRLGACLAEAESDHPSQVAIVRLLLYTGARAMEIGGLQWEWVQAPRLLLPDSKSGPKTIWLCSQALAIIEAIPRREGTPFVFPNWKGTAPLIFDNWWFKFRRHCALPDVRIHDLRHSYASIAIREKGGAGDHRQIARPRVARDDRKVCPSGR